jgi:uncharacterized coiled-coil DUF342 family protein
MIYNRDHRDQIYPRAHREIRDQRSEIRDQRSEIRDQRSEIRDQRSEIRDQRSEIRDQRSHMYLLIFVKRLETSIHVATKS